MAIAAIVLGVLAILLALGGMVMTPVPGVGAALSLSAPVVALVGIVLGGVSMSRAKEEGTEGGAAMAGLIVSIVAFFPALFVALTCGVCNSLCTASVIDQQLNPQRQQPAFWIDAGPSVFPPPDPTAPPTPPDPNTIDPSAIDPTVPGEPPPAFPPPIPSGPVPTEPAPTEPAPTP